MSAGAVSWIGFPRVFCVHLLSSAYSPVLRDSVVLSLAVQCGGPIALVFVLACSGECFTVLAGPFFGVRGVFPVGSRGSLSLAPARFLLSSAYSPALPNSFRPKRRCTMCRPDR